MYDSLLNGKGDQFLNVVKDCKTLFLEGIATHFSCADKLDTDFTDIQIRRFKECIDYIKKKGLSTPMIHMANSAAILRQKITFSKFLDTEYLMRSGLSAYGIDPIHEDSSKHALKPVITMTAPIVSRKTLMQGLGVGYGRFYRANSAKELAIVAIGYADGLHRRLVERGFALVSGIRAPFLGNFSMDSLAIDVTEVIKQKGFQAAELGSVVTFLGRDGKDEITASLIAKASGTIPFEVLTSIAARVPRVLK